MNREEAIKIFQDKLRTMEHGAICCNYGNDKDAFLLAIQALEQESCKDKYLKEIDHLRKYIIKLETQIVDQEPCEDAISKQAVEKITWEEPSYTDPFNVLTEVREKVRALPPVTPHSKTGHWIKEKTLHGWDGKSYQCSECGRSIHIDPEVEDLTDYSYCHCGAIMTESEENK